jgi:hypothetical protein
MGQNESAAGGFAQDLEEKDAWKDECYPIESENVLDAGHNSI